ncbi:MAG: YceI family protein [Chloroflexi bacterium]|nr:YceI family protein [Chloroflexota bacterium]
MREQLVRLRLPNDAVLETTSGLSGKVYLDGRATSITLDLHTLQSDQDFRDQYVRRTMFPRDRTAVMTVGDVTPLPEGFIDGQEVKTRVEGALKIRGVETQLVFDIEARDDGDVVYVVARSSFTWADIGMTAPKAQSVVWVDDTVHVEVLLALRPAGAATS